MTLIDRSVERSTSSSIPSETPSAIELNNVSKRFGDHTVVPSTTLKLPSGGIVAVVGPNGCGKTTTLAMVAGILYPTTGEILVEGTNIADIDRARIGVLLNGPAFLPYLSGTKNLQILADLSGVSRWRVGEVLREVGMQDSAHRRVDQYSLGMRQRLGIAATLLSNPSVLLLDEPFNGLDPIAARELRTYLRAMADRGCTLLVSSHHIKELEAIADLALVFSSDGTMRLAQSSELLAATSVHIHVEVEERNRMRDLAHERGYESTVDGKYIHIMCAVDAAAELNRVAVGAGISVIEMRINRADLETMFFEGAEK